MYLDVPLKHCSHHWYTLVQSMYRSQSASVPYCVIVFAICSIVPLSTISCTVNYIMYITYVHIHQNVLQRTNFCGIWCVVVLICRLFHTAMVYRCKLFHTNQPGRRSVEKLNLVLWQQSAYSLLSSTSSSFKLVPTLST